MGCGCRGVGNGFVLRRAVFNQLSVDGFYAGIGEFVERQYDEYVRVEYYRYYVEQNFDGGEYFNRLYVVVGGIVDVRQDLVYYRFVNRQVNFQVEQVGGEYQFVEAAIVAVFFVVYYVRSYQLLQRRGGIKDEQEQDVEGKNERDVFRRGDENQQVDQRVGDDDLFEGGDAVEAVQQA